MEQISKRRRTLDLEENMSNQGKNISGLHKVGFTIYKNALDIPEDVYNELYSQVIKRKRTIFNNNETRRTDYKRSQCGAKTSKKIVKQFFIEANDFLVSIIPSITKNLRPMLTRNKLSEQKGLYIANPWYILHSSPGCQRQAAHCDYEQDESLLQVPDRYFPLAALVAIQDNTTIEVWPSAIKIMSTEFGNTFPIERQTLKLDEGDVFIFRGDLVHAGSSYSEENIRLHTYIDSTLVSRTKNRTWTIKKDGTETMRNMII